MKVLLISKEGDGLGIAHRLVLEGHHVDVWIKVERYRRGLVGIVSHVGDWRPSLRNCDLVICDMVGVGGLGDALKQSGKPVIGANEYVDRVELDRALGMEMFQRAGIDIPETLSFRDKAEIELPEPWGSGWVIKPSGNKSTCQTMVVKEQELWEHCVSKIPEGCPLIVQRIIDGVEVSTEGWFNGRDWVRPFNHTFEEKRFLNGNLGVNTGCMGNVVLAAEGNRLTKATVERVGPFLKMVGYRGPFDINCIVTEQAAFGLEATGRIGYDAIEALAELLDEPLGDLLFEVAAGTKRTMALDEDRAIAVRLSIPPWPVRNPDQSAYGEPVLGIEPEILPHIFLCDVYKDGERYLTAGGDGVLLKATARSPNLSLARKRVYRLLDGIQVSSKQYRTDIGERVVDDLDRLRSWGWLG